MPLILCIESTAFHCSVALFEDKTLLSEQVSTTPNSHSELLGVMIDAVIKEKGKNPADLDAIAVSSGPGSYTSLRVGASLAKGMCFALDIPLITIDSLLITAFPYFSETGTNSKVLVIPTIDARRDEAYISIYSATGSVLKTAHPHIFTKDSFKDLDCEEVLICGNAATKASSIIQDNRLNIKESHPSARYMGILALDSFTKNTFADVAYFEPNYIKLPNITTPKKPLI